MTPQEQQMIDGLISRIRNTQVQNKDTEAEQHIQGGLGGFPDALYVLTQTVLVQGYGLEQAKSQLNELKQQNQVLQDQLRGASQHQQSSSGSFLSHIFGSGSSSQAPAPPPPPQAGQYQPVNNPGYSTQGYPPPPPPPVAYPAGGYSQGGGMFGGGGGGFLQGALQTAAGVAAGEMVFQGMEDLFHGFGGHQGGYGFGGGPGGETIVNNNYYDDDRRSDRDSGDRGSDRDSGDRGRDDPSFYNPSDDASRSNFGDTAQGSSDRGSFGDNSARFTDSNDDLATDDNSTDDNSTDDNSTDDNSTDDATFDDSSNDDSSSSDDNS